ncbi:class I SAM-dependent methyltransferase [Arthrobacter roseus]|uniref:class I SAM-dependent methyltransferase n=1 Tax=Arthrobacter roseus TaxID=136274 RepID=UPI0019627920|nr:class I SAM-dependent methyltransferase [Arthrobacter roseus]MBM7849060.1 SAM-dependent methyltransferase [Arthrobacter roseus]
MAGTGPKIEANRRRELSEAFQTGADHYDRVRPGYPPDAVVGLIPAGAQDAVDVGAGTGKLTTMLVDLGLNVKAVDPSSKMLEQLSRRLPDVAVIAGTAEETSLPDSCSDVVTVAQAWHWCDPLMASAEAARILRRGGTLALIWNQLDTSVPWVHRFSRIIHAGDVLKPNFSPTVGPDFSQPERQLTPWALPMTIDELIGLAQSRSFYLAAGQEARTRLLANLNWYLLDHLGHERHDVLELPYLAFGFRSLRLR